MSKIRIGVEQKDKVKRKDIEFDFREIQTRNPRLQGKTPLYLYTRELLTRVMKPKKGWWEK